MSCRFTFLFDSIGFSTSYLNQNALQTTVLVFSLQYYRTVCNWYGRCLYSVKGIQYIEYQSFCAVVWFGSPHSVTRANWLPTPSVFLLPVCIAWGGGRVAPNHTTAQKLWFYFIYTTPSTVYRKRIRWFCVWRKCVGFIQPFNCVNPLNLPLSYQSSPFIAPAPNSSSERPWKPWNKNRK